MSAPRHPQIKNLNEIEAVDTTHGIKFGGFRKRLAAESGSKEIAMCHKLPPKNKKLTLHIMI